MISSVPPARVHATAQPSVVGVAAIAAVLHVAVLAGRVPPRHSQDRQAAMLAWEVPSCTSSEVAAVEDGAASNPLRSYCAGRLALTFGMAVVALAGWLQVMRINGARSF